MSSEHSAPLMSDTGNGSSSHEFSYADAASASATTSSDGFKNEVHDLEADREAAEAESDTSEPARAARSLMTYRASLGEFCATFVLTFTAIGVGVATNERVAVAAKAAAGANEALTVSSSLLISLIGSVLGGVVVAFIATALIYSFAPISGCHMNPAVTVALFASGRTSARKAGFYIVSQFIGALTAMLALLLVFNLDTNVLSYAVIKPAESANAVSVFGMEFLLTFILVFIIFKVAFEGVDEEKKKTMSFKAVGGARGLTIFAPTPQSRLGFAPLAIGLVVGVLGTLGSSVSGGVYNPAIYLASQIFAGNITSWAIVYVIAHLTGACTAVLMRFAFDHLGKQALALEDQAAVLRKENRSHHA